MRTGHLIVIGGAEDKIRDRVILSRFVALAGGREARIAVVATASSFAAEVGERYREVFTDLADRLRAVDERIAAYDRRVDQLARQTEPAQRLMQVPGVGPVTATALIATVGHAHAFVRGRGAAGRALRHHRQLRPADPAPPADGGTQP